MIYLQRVINSPTNVVELKKNEILAILILQYIQIFIEQLYNKITKKLISSQV